MQIAANILLQHLTPYKGDKVALKSTQSTNDIIAEILKAHTLHAKDYNKIANKFWTGNILTTCKKIFDFLKKNVKYSVEPDTRQSVKSPAAILSTGMFLNGYNDCKHYSQFIAGILDALNRQGKKINWVYRFANYKTFETTPHHVFVVVKNNGKEIWIDPVLKYFNEKKPYTNKIDKKMLYSISGLGNGNLSIVAGNKAKRQQKRAVRKAERKARPKKRILLKVGAAPARNAFLKLVALNAFGMAVRLQQALNNPTQKEKLLSKWQKLGGNKNNLINNINKGYKLASKRGKTKGVQKIGEPVTIAAILAIATPIVAALAEFLPKITKGKADQAVQDISETAAAQKEASQSNSTDNSTKEVVTMQKSSDSHGNEVVEMTDTNTSSSNFLSNNKNLILIGGGLILAVALLKRK